MSHNPSPEKVEETAFAMKARAAREDANKQNFVDVDYSDLDFFIGNCRRLKDKESFDTALRVLEAIKKQVLGQ